MKSRKYFVIAGMLLLVLLGACSGAARDVDTDANSDGHSETETLRLINVTGTGKVYITPDIAYIYIGVRSQSEDVAEALKENTAQSQAVSSSLKELGVDEKDIQTSSFNIYPQQEYGMNGQITGTIYHVENTVYVIVRDLANLGKMLDVVVRSGANSINSIQFDVDDRSGAVSEARKLAVEDGRAQAEELAEAADVQLGDLVNLSVYGTSTPYPVYDTLGKGGGYAVAESEVPVSAGQMVISVDASLAYEIIQ